MIWQHQQSHPWASPLDVAANFQSEDMALLYSSRVEGTTGTISFLLLKPKQSFEGVHWSDLPAIPVNAHPDLPYYVGYLGYGMREDVLRGQPSIINLPDFRLTRYERLLRFNHATQVIDEFMMRGTLLPPLSLLPQQHHVTNPADSDTIKIRNLRSNFTRETYEQSVARTIECIRAGDFYQANITRKFFGEFDDTPDYFKLFNTLCKLSPAAYSAYIRHGDTAILSSSPECFLTINAQGVITSRPIKGSAARHHDAATDEAVRNALAASEKNLAENLMIVDLMRNDLAKVSHVGSVHVQEQSSLHSYQTIHHLVSTVTAQKLSGTSAYEVTRACFAPGSMTGAPKIAAMNWCAEQEILDRGVYSGALGWFGGANTCDLSVVIRTLICQNDRFEFQVGGGIVADSTPSDEWRETLIKARALIALLDINENDIKK